MSTAPNLRVPPPPLPRATPPPVPSPVPPQGNRPEPPPIPPKAKLPARRHTLLQPAELDRFKNLLVFAQSAVDGYFAGKHPSPDFGSNAEFAEHKQYAAGEDVTHIDWRVYARSRKLVVKRYREETDMVVYLLVDMSRSMAYQGAGTEDKMRVAGRIAAALAYLMVRQGDKVALALFQDRISRFFPPGGTRRHLFELVGALEHAVATTSGGTDLAGALGQCAGLFKKRGRIVVVSDFLEAGDGLFDALSQFSHRQFEILLLHVADPHELDLPTVPLAQFVDMESGESVQVEPDAIRRAYRDEMDAFVAHLGSQADRRRIDYAFAGTGRPYLDALEAYLGFRERVRK
ncbi:DUF58 domain-containing protein [soil metagenome]